MVAPVGIQIPQTQQVYNNPQNNWITKKTVKSVEIRELVQTPKTFSDCFKENTKKLLPFGAVITGLWAIIDSTKSNNKILKSLVSNALSIAPVLLAISVVKAYMESGTNQKK